MFERDIIARPRAGSRRVAFAREGSTADRLRSVRQSPCLTVLIALLWSANASAQAVPPSCPADLATADIIEHDLSVSFCELCDVGTVRLEIENPFSPSDDVGDFAALVVTENLLASGLTYAGSTAFGTDNVSGGSPPVVQPAVSGPNGSILTWTIDSDFELDAQPGGSGNRARLFIEFQVRRAPGLSEEGLIDADRTIEASVELEPDCGLGDAFETSTGFELPLREPEPEIEKEGRNVDANQNAFAGTVFGHRHDDVIWRIRVTNAGEAELQDMRLDDAIGPGFEFRYACSSNGDAEDAANGSPGSCDPLGGTDTVNNLVLADVLGVGTVIGPGDDEEVYLVGRITDSCITDSVNTVDDVEWGCEVEPPPGGIDETSEGIIPGDTAEFNSNPTPTDLNVSVALTGTNTSQPMGAKGTVTITVANQTGGTVRDIRLRDLLPVQYVIDPTFMPTVSIDRPGGHDPTYDGMIDTITWTNPEPGTFPDLTSTNPADPLANTELTFELTSSTVQNITEPDPNPNRYRNMLRHGDVMTIRFRTILIDPTYYDKVAHIDVVEESPASNPAGTDPTTSFAIANELEIWFEELCTDTEHNPAPITTNDTAEPEDLDVDTSAIIYILTNTDPTPLTVRVTNNGGHDADDYFVYVSFGNAMVVDTLPAGCSATTNPPTIRGSNAPLWVLPDPVPASASVYVCDVGVVGAGSTESLVFDVVKNPAPGAIDDLMFRADVIGEIWLSNPDENGNQALWFPTPTVRSPEDGLLDLANNYTLDAVRARVLGFNLTKAQAGICTENNPPPGSPDDKIQIGEECSFHIESGGWFGFDTTGFDYIGVWDIVLDDLLPDGQGYISQQPPVTTPEINTVALTPPPAPVPVSEGTFGWTFNTVDNDAQRIDVKDEWFFVDVTTRLLNDPVDTRAVPNLHAEASTNVMLSTFEAIFENPLTGEREHYDIDDNVVGYPPEFRRQVDLTVTEPNLILTKEVCNETLYGAGPSCSSFTTLADDGDAFDTYLYRIAIENEASAGGVPRAPAYDVTVTSVTDPSDMLFVDPLTGDVLDNDGDALVDGADAAGEGLITDNTTENGAPAEVVASYPESDALLRIDPGESVVLYYRVDPDDDVAPLQQLTSTVTAAYDSLEGEFGSQTDPPRPNGDVGGARQYVSEPAEAVIRIIPVEVIPKRILRLSNTAPVASGPQPVSIGEELEFELRTQIPVSQLRNFVIRDELPAGMRCTEAPDVDLGAPPYDAGGFVPGGVITPTCTADEVVWDFGDQTVTQAPGGANRFDFGIQFIARIDNAAANQDGTVIGNGGAYTVTTVSYIDEANNSVVIDFEAAEVLVSEPLIELEKAFAVDTADAADRLTVTVTATNTGSATAYNLRVLDDLTGTDLAYVGDVAGANPPTSVDTTTYGPDSPLFTWDPGFGIAAGDSASFTFVVQVADSVEPLQVLTNTIQADWTSLPGPQTALNTGGSIGANGAVDGMRIGALPSAGDAINDYEAQATDSVSVPPLAIAKTDLDPALPPAIGSHRTFEVRIDLPEGMSNGVVLNDDLAFGSVSYLLADNADFGVTYEFVGIESINDQAPAITAFNATPADGASGTAVWDVGVVVTETEDDAAAGAVSPYIRISYAARINNDLDTNVGSVLQNSATANYVNGETGGQESVNAETAPVTAIEPNLTATKAISNVTPGKDPGDPIALGDTIEYLLTIPNIGNAAARDVTIVDTLPPELTLDTSFTPAAEIDGVNVAGFAGAPAGSPDGPLVWGARNGDGSLDVAPGSTLEVTYRTVLRAPADEDIALTNVVWTDWTSLDDASAYERTGDGCPTITPPNDYCYGPASADGTPFPVGPPDALQKANTQPTASIGEAFRYRITIPGTPHPLPLYDVRIVDDLAASAADLSYVAVTKVAGSGTWTPANAGTPTSLAVEDAAGGIDIPIGEQIVLDVTVRLDDTATNVRGLNFTNTASFTYNRLDDAPATQLPGAAGTTQPMTIVEPYEVTLEKSGPPQVQLGVPGTFTLDVHNIGDSAAYNLSVTDVLPNQADGGMCDQAPSGFTAQVFEADGTTAVSPVLVEGTDYAVDFQGDPDCTLRLSLLTAAGAIGADQRLIVTYQSYLDTDSQQGANLTNVAGASEWFSIDVSDADQANYARRYARALTDGTVNTLDHEDAHTVVVFTPLLIFEKTVVNVTSGEGPATVATPGDTLRYSVRVENASDTPLDGFSIVDELDRLNATPSFQPGSLNVITLPAGADSTSTDPNGGAAGTGLLDIRNLKVGGLGESVLIEFEVVLAGVLPDDSYVSNQSEIRFAGFPVGLSDDPHVNGAADPNVAGDEDPTRIQIDSAAALRIEKISTYLDGDPNVLLAGERLRYTITVQNTGTDNASGVELVDQLPANTTYVAGSTTLNGIAVADSATGGLPLVDGIPIHAPQDPTQGVMNAGVADNVARIVFDVVVYPDLPDGTIISNQAFVSAVDYGIADQPSDDPRTPVPDDPTRDIVGNLPLLFAEKSAALEVDLGSPGIVDPGDVLRYTIAIYNNGAIPATAVRLADSVPADTTYVADTVTLNGLAVGAPDGGVFPLAAGIDVSSADLTPPLPGADAGVLSPGGLSGQSAIVQFDLQVNAGTPAGTLITNQATVYSDELPNLLTDGDGNPTTGPEPTVVVVGDAQQLTITKAVSVVNGGPALAGSTLEYVVTVTNVSAVPALYTVITDNLDEPNPGYLTYVDQSATLNGLTDGVTFAGTTLTADYATEYGPLNPGATAVLRFRAVINPDLANGTRITNTAHVTWNDPPQHASASVSIDVGAMPGFGMLSGTVWHDSDFTDTPGDAERLLEGWTVELLMNGKPVRSALTDASGDFLVASVTPNYLTEDQYALRFSAPGAGSRTASLGYTDSDFTDGPQRIDDIVVTPGSNLLALNLPIDPDGVVYDSVARSPVAGATVTLLDAGGSMPVPAACFDDAVQQEQVTTANGYYKFDIDFSDPGCPSGGNYVIRVVPPGSSYVPGPSELIPPASDVTTVPFDVPSCPGSANDAITATSEHCELQASEFPPPASVPARSAGTTWHSFLTLSDSQRPGSSQLFNNHIPIDPVLTGAVSVTKSTPMLNVTRGQLVPYVITVTNTFEIPLADLSLIDRFPAGFRYVDGSARFDDVPTEPAVLGRELHWSNLTLASEDTHTIKLLLAVGAGVTEGEFVNRAWAASSLTGNALSEEASATVRVIPDPTFDCTDVTGKVFDDHNRNGYQDGDEGGLPGVRVVTARGLTATTDEYGRFHFTCAITPRESRGSNFVLKLDDRTLPSGYRASTPPVLVKRATRGKALRFNFGASIHRVVGLDIAGAVFEPDSTAIRHQWQSRIPLLLEELKKGPAVLRLSYVADIESEQLVERRLEAMKTIIMDAWTELACCYELAVEPEIYWRLGAPPDIPDDPQPVSR